MVVTTRRKICDELLVLPMILVINILSRLPVKFLLECKLVSKSWRNLISSEDFAKSHLKQSQESDTGRNVIIYSGGNVLQPFNFLDRNSRVIKLMCPNFFKTDRDSAKELIGSSNGLLCFNVDWKFVLYNPATRCRKIIPKLVRKCGSFFSGLSEFGYGRITDDYKILKITKSVDSQNGGGIGSAETHVYSSRANSWKSIECPLGDLTYLVTEGVVVNNHVHLIDYGDKVIRSFDLYTDTFTHGLSLPQEVSNTSRLVFLRGHWHLALNCCNLKIYKNNCWTTLYSCPPTQVYSRDLTNSQVLMFDYLKDGDKILIGATVHHSRKFFWYDTQTKQISDLNIPGSSRTPRRVTFVKPWVESLMSPNGWRR